MGQYGNQPDFGTKAQGINPNGTPISALTGGPSLNSAALYIGIGGTLVCQVVGGNSNNGGLGWTVFENIPDGTFFPVIINRVFDNDGDEGDFTTCSKIVALY